jgi:hypothetical protein
MATEAHSFFAGFKWAIPSAFADALGACQFSRGDMLYSSSVAYREWNKEFYEMARGLYAIKILSPEAKPAPPSPSLFGSNWNTQAEAEIYNIGEQEGAKRFITTQGRIYSLLWRGDRSILDAATSAPLVPHQAGYLLKALEDIKSSISQLIMGKVSDARYFFALPHDLCSQLLEGKYQKLFYGLQRTHNISVMDVSVEALPVPEASRIAPTVSLKIFAFRHDDENAIRESLKELLYIQAVDKKSNTDKFRLNAHGLFAAV